MPVPSTASVSRRVFTLVVTSAAMSIIGRSAQAQHPARTTSPSTAPTPGCSSCAEWNTPRRPFRVFGNTYYVGTDGLASILIVGDRGDVLIDGALPESAPVIAANIEALGFRLHDVKLILNSHAHFDHAGGIAWLAQRTGARVAASPPSRRELTIGGPTRDDPQYGVASKYPPVAGVRALGDGDTVRVGALALAAHVTPGHTPGGTTWTWRSCEGERCVDIVYADSQTPVSADDFLFTHNATYPRAIADFAHSADVVERLSCDILLTPHPGVSDTFGRLAARERGDADAFIDRDACRQFAAASRMQVRQRIAKERGAP